VKLWCQSQTSRDPMWRARQMRREEKLMCRIKRLRHRITKGDAAAKVPLLAKAAAVQDCSQSRDS